MIQLDILAFGAHPDDVEISAGATLLKYAKEGKKIGIVDLTQGELGTRGSSELRAKEAKAASDFLGLSIRENLEMKDGFFEFTVENKMAVIEVIRKYRPTLVMANSLSDRHPDHARAGRLISDACFLAGLRKIESYVDGEPQAAFRPHLVLHYIQDHYIKPDFVYDVTGYADEKIKLISCFNSQFYNPDSQEPETPISGEEFFDFIRGRMLGFGRSIGVKHGEGFNASRQLGIKDLFALK